jgi:hypothetical protein
VNAGIEHSLLSALDRRRLDLDLGVLVCLLAEHGRDPPVCDQALERQPGDLAADPVEAGDDDRVRRLVDDDVDAGEALERADLVVVALAC